MHINLQHARTEWSQRPLPRPNRRLTALAVRLARCAGRVMEVGDQTALIGVTAERDTVRLTWWNHRMEVWAEITAGAPAFSPATSVEGALQRAGNALLDYFAGRWPDGASPPALGVVTDGIGVAFSPNYPAPCTPGWLDLHGSGRAYTITLLPFGDGSLFDQQIHGRARLH